MTTPHQTNNDQQRLAQAGEHVRHLQSVTRGAGCGHTGLVDKVYFVGLVHGLEFGQRADTAPCSANINRQLSSFRSTACSTCLPSHTAYSSSRRGTNSTLLPVATWIPAKFPGSRTPNAQWKYDSCRHREHVAPDAAGRTWRNRCSWSVSWRFSSSPPCAAW